MRRLDKVAADLAHRVLTPLEAVHPCAWIVGGTDVNVFCGCGLKWRGHYASLRGWAGSWKDDGPCRIAKEVAVRDVILA